MGMPNHGLAVSRVNAIKGYQELFKKAHPGQKDPINIDNLAGAIAKFEETLETLDSPFDKFKAEDKDAISEEAKEGYKLFQLLFSSRHGINIACYLQVDVRDFQSVAYVDGRMHPKDR